MFNINDDSIIDGIGYCIQDQEVEYLLDLNSGKCVMAEDCVADDADYVSLPTWSSARGFRIMSSFADLCRDRDLACRLRETLYQGKGVFRRFRGILESSPDTLEEFYNFRDASIRSYIRSYLRENYIDKADIPNPLLSVYDIEYRMINQNAFPGPGTLDALQSRFCSCLDNPQAIIVKNHEGKDCGILAYGFIGDVPYVFHYYIEENYRRHGLFSFLVNLFMSKMTREGKKEAVIPVVESFSFVLNEFQSSHSAKKIQMCGIDIPAWNDVNVSVETCYVF